jgi:hypothetical protein
MLLILDILQTAGSDGKMGRVLSTRPILPEVY